MMLIFILLSAQAIAADEQAGGKTCVDVEIGTSDSYACINQELQQAVQAAPHLTVVPDLRAASPPNATGMYNRAATAERLGNAFGHSVVPQRPAPQVVVPLFPAR